MAGYRYRLIDHLLRKGREWNFEAFHREINEGLHREFGYDGISIRMLLNDIQVMRMEYPEGYGAPIKRSRGMIFYEDPNFSIQKAQLPKRDFATLEEAVGILQQTQAIPVAESLEEVIFKLSGNPESDNHSIIWLDRNDQVAGLHWLGVLYRSARNHVTMTLEYQPFDAQKSSRLTFCPYILREFNNRWFAIGWVKEHDSTWTLALDRIKKAYANNLPWRENDFFTPEERFADIIGVSLPENQRPSRIRLLFSAYRAQYILTKPLHGSQKLVTQYPDGRIEVEVRLIINPELLTLILGFGKDVQVLQPVALKKLIADNLAAALAFYPAT